MKTIVIYNSKTGFTKQYAEWIAKELNCQALPDKKAAGQLAGYECIVYGGWIMAGKIAGFDKIKQKAISAGKKLVVYATGATPSSMQEMVDNIKNQNLTPEEQEKVPFFYLEGGINFEKMGFFSKKMLKMMGNMLAKKQDRTEEEEGMLSMFQKSSDYSDQSYIQPLVECVRTLDNQ